MIPDTTNASSCSADIIPEDVEEEQAYASKTSTVSPKTLQESDQESPGAARPRLHQGQTCPMILLNGQLSSRLICGSKSKSWRKFEDEQTDELTSLESSVRNESSHNRAHSWSGRRTSSLFNNLFMCRQADIKETALLALQRQKRYQTDGRGSWKESNSH